MGKKRVRRKLTVLEAALADALERIQALETFLSQSVIVETETVYETDKDMN